MKYDVIVIGAGHNGLVCGAYLAKAGLKVIVLEREDLVGGCIKTKVLPDTPGFKWDVFANAHQFITGNPLLRNKEIPLERYGLKYIPVDRPFGTPFPDGDSIVLHSEPKKTLDSLRKHSEEDAIAFENIYNLYLKVKDELLTFFFSYPSKIEAFLKFRSLSKKLGGKDGILELIRTISLSPRVFVEEIFKNDKVRAWLVPWGLHPDYGPEVSFGSAIAFMAATILQEFGGLVPEGGSGMLSQALANYIKDKEGEIKTDSTVENIILKNGKAEAVKIENGEIIEVNKAIIACIEPKQLFLKMIGEENLPSDFIIKVKRYRYGIAGMKIDFALNEPIKWKAGEDINRTLQLHIAPSIDYCAKAYNEAFSGILPKEPFMIVSQTSVHDKKRAPEGKAVLWITVRTVPYEIKGDSIGKIKGDNWNGIKNKYGERIIDIIDSYTENFKNNIINFEIQSPVDLERNNLNLVRGDITAGSHHFDQSFIFRPYPSLKPYRTPFNGLYMTGSSTFPGAGINGASGRIAA